MQIRKFSSTDQPEFLILVALTLLAGSIPLRFLMKKYECIIPFNFYLVVIGIVCATIYFTWLNKFIYIPLISPYSVLTVYLPFYTISTVYCIDFFTFMRSLPQTLLITWVGVLINVTILGLLLKHILHADWPYTMGFLAALACIPVQPDYVIKMLSGLSKYKYLSTILEAESILSMIPVLILFKIGHFLIEKHDHFANEITTMFIAYVFGGLAVGVFVGKLTAMLMCWLYSEPLSSLCVAVGMILFTFVATEYLLEFSSVISSVCLVSFISIEKHRFSTEVDNCFRTFWKTMNFVTQALTLLYSTMSVVGHLWIHFDIKDIYGTMITYFTANVARIMSFQLMGIFLNKMRYEINVRCLVVLGWSGIKGNLNLMLALVLLSDIHTREYALSFVLDITVYTLLSLTINSGSMRITLQLIGLSELTASKKNNMSNCIQFVMTKRLSAINILKQDRYFTQANWAIVRQETQINNPYKTIAEEDEDVKDDEDQQFIWRMNRTMCPVCVSELPFDLLEKDLAELMKEAQIKTLKAKKVSIIKQYENGNIDKNCQQVLVHAYEMMIESNPKTNVISLKSYFRRNIWLEYLVIILKILTVEKIQLPPKSQYRRLCYYTVMHYSYDYIMFGIVLVYDIMIAYYIYAQQDSDWFDGCMLIHLLFIIDFYIKCVGYSKDRYLTGFIFYVRYMWNIFDLVFLIFGLADMFVMFGYRLKGHYLLVMTMKYICLVRIVKIFQILQPLYRKLLRIIEYRVDSRACFGYDLATALEKSSDEILGVIGQIIASKFINDIYTKQIKEEKRSLIRQLEHVQKERPWIAITVKTKQAIRTTLNSMENALNELKVTGFVDNVEYGYIWKEIVSCQKVLRNMKFIQPSNRMVIFHEVPWIAANKQASSFLYDHAQIVTWEAGDFICRDGTPPVGVYIVIDGMLRIYYVPKTDTREQLRDFGTLPIVDHLASLKFDVKIEMNISPGTTIGELSVLTNRPYDCTVVAESAGAAFVLPPDMIKAAMKLNDDPVLGLEATMWKYSVIDLAVAILTDIPLYQSFSPEEIKFKLQSAFVPNLHCYKMFVITEMMDEVLLMEGIVADYHSNDIFTGPMLIPRTVQKIILPSSSVLPENLAINTKLLILPTSEANAYDIMEYEEDIAELVSIPSSRCLVHRKEVYATGSITSSKSKKSFVKK